MAAKNVNPNPKIKESKLNQYTSLNRDSEMNQDFKLGAEFKSINSVEEDEIDKKISLFIVPYIIFALIVISSIYYYTAHLTRTSPITRGGSVVTQPLVIPSPENTKNAVPAP